MNLEHFEKEFGSVECFGRKIAIMLKPIIGFDGFEAIGKDEDGNQYSIKWPITDPFSKSDSDAFDWLDFTAKKL